MVENDDDVLKELPDEAIELTFPCDDMEIAVLNNELFNNRVNENDVMLCAIGINENGERVLTELTSEEYEKAFQVYLDMIKLFGGKN